MRITERWNVQGRKICTTAAITGAPPITLITTSNTTQTTVITNNIAQTPVDTINTEAIVVTTLEAIIVRGTTSNMQADTKPTTVTEAVLTEDQKTTDDDITFAVFKSDTKILLNKYSCSSLYCLWIIKKADITIIEFSPELLIFVSIFLLIRPDRYNEGKLKINIIYNQSNSFSF